MPDGFLHPDPAAPVPVTPPQATQAAGAGARLTPREAEVARLYAAAWSAHAIAEKLGIGVERVHDLACQAKRKGAVFPRQEMPALPRRHDWSAIGRLAREGKRQVEITAILGLSQQTVSRILKTMREAGMNLPSKPAPGPARSFDYARCKALYLDARSLSIREIARQLGCGEASVHSALNAMRAAGEVIPYRCRNRLAVADLPQREVVAPTVARHRCMSCRREGAADAPRFFICSDCKSRDVAGLPEAFIS